MARRTTNLNYSVRPRYSPGSPALVDERTAVRVAKDERDAFLSHLEGHYGEVRQAWAERAGLRGIVEERVERRGGWDIVDYCTGERVRREQIKPMKLKVGDVVVEAATDSRTMPMSFKVKEKPEKVAGAISVRVEGEEPRRLFSPSTLVTVERVTGSKKLEVLRQAIEQPLRPLMAHVELAMVELLWEQGFLELRQAVQMGEERVIPRQGFGGMLSPGMRFHATELGRELAAKEP